MKIINFLGDSITEGAIVTSYEKSFVPLVGKMLGAQVHNYGIGGTRIAKQRNCKDYHDFNRDFVTRAYNLFRWPDFTFVFGGTNDFGHGDAPIGDYNSEDDYTFCGALNNLLKLLIEMYGKDKICFIIPLPRNNDKDPRGDGKPEPVGTLEDYNKIIRSKCTDFGIDYLDFSKEFASLETSKEMTVDGLHPNDKGHQLLAELLVNYLKTKKGF